MPRPFDKLTRHALPALAAVAVSLAVPFLASAGDVTGTATNVTGFAAQETQDGGRPGNELFPVGSEAFAKARSIADAHWGTPACKGEVAISWVSIDQGTNATASWRNPSDAWNNPGENFDCTIELNANVGFDLPKLCTVLAHELGHLVGQQHAAQSGQLMSPVYSDALPACAAMAPAAPAPAPAAPAATQAPAPARTAAPSTRRTVKTFVRTTTTAKGVKVTDAAGSKRTLRRTSTRCVRVLRAGRRVKRCTRVVRRAAAVAAARR